MGVCVLSSLANASNILSYIHVKIQPIILARILWVCYKNWLGSINEAEMLNRYNVHASLFNEVIHKCPMRRPTVDAIDPFTFIRLLLLFNGFDFTLMGPFCCHQPDITILLVSLFFQDAKHQSFFG